jgi:hypothetical protein
MSFSPYWAKKVVKGRLRATHIVDALTTNISHTALAAVPAFYRAQTANRYPP